MGVSYLNAGGPVEGEERLGEVGRGVQKRRSLSTKEVRLV